jgi:hypothetical protein
MSGGAGGDLLSLLNRDMTPPRRRAGGVSLALTSPESVREIGRQTQSMIGTGLRIIQNNARLNLEDIVAPILRFTQNGGAAVEHKYKKYTPPTKLKSENEINYLTQKIGSRKGKKTNIDIINEKPKKERKQKKSRNGDFTAEQKWRIYKTKVEPKIIDQIVQEEPSQIELSIKNAFKDLHIPNMKNIIKNAEDENDDLDKTDLTHAKEVLYNDIVNVPVQATNNEVDKTIPNGSHMAETDVEKLVKEREQEQKRKRRQEDKERKKDKALSNKSKKEDLKDYNRELSYKITEEKKAIKEAKEAEKKAINEAKKAEKQRLDEAKKKQQAIVDNYHRVVASDKIGNNLLSLNKRNKYNQMRDNEIAAEAAAAAAERIEGLAKAAARTRVRLSKPSAIAYGIKGRPTRAVAEQIQEVQRDLLMKTGRLPTPKQIRAIRAELSAKS